MRILIINGPNINMLGIREKNIYGSKNYKDLIKYIKEYTKEKDIEIEIYQSNSEGQIINKIQEAYNLYDGIVINPAGLYSYINCNFGCAKSCKYSNS